MNNIKCSTVPCGSAARRKSFTSLLLAALAILILFTTSACKFGFQEILWRDNPVDQRSTSFQQIAPPDTLNPVPPTPKPKKYDCLLIADTHFGNDNYSVPEEAFFAWLDNYINTKGLPKLCIMLGDVVDHATANEYDQFAAFQQRIKLKMTGIPVYNVVGNHDVYNSGWDLWKKTCPPHTSTYYFETEDFIWYFLDTASGTLGRPQFYDLKDKLAQSSKPKLVFTHYPLYGGGIFYFCLSNPRERAELISLFARTNVKLYCSGHYHAGAFYDYGPFQEHVVKALGQFGMCHVLHVDNGTYTIENIQLR